MSDLDDIISSAIESILSKYLDEDTCHYIHSILIDNDETNGIDSDTKESIQALIEGSMEEPDDSLCKTFFQRLENTHQTQTQTQTQTPNDNVPIRKLTQSITMKDSDMNVETFAMGLRIEDDGTHESSGTITTTVSGYDDSQTKPIQSERQKRKERQKKLRQFQEEQDRQRAIQDEMIRFQSKNEIECPQDEEGNINVDVHFRNFDLHNAAFHSPNNSSADVLLSNANFTLSSHRRYGLMGRNGCGKTTLMNAIASRSLGQIPSNMSVLLVKQEIMGSEKTALQTVLYQSNVKYEAIKQYITQLEQQLEQFETDTGDSKEENRSSQRSRQRLRQRATNGKSKIRNKKSSKDIQNEKQNIVNQLSSAHEKLVELETTSTDDDTNNYHNPEGRARKLLSGLGFSREMQDKPTKELSGGWRMRVSLTCALFAEPNLLLLDEPTNHLDLEAVLWLERWLTTKYQGTLVVVSHDRHFLNEVVTDVVHFHRNKLTAYRGDIDNFVAVVEENKKRQIRLRQTQEAKREHLQKYIDLHAQSGENGVKAAKQRKSRMKKLDKIGVMQHEGRRFKQSYDGAVEEVEEYQEDDEVKLIFPDPGGFDKIMIQLEQLYFHYQNQSEFNINTDYLLKDVDMTIDAKSRIALLGRNGCGKSTLIKLIVGNLNATKGKVTINPRAKIEYLAQHQLEQLDPDGNPLQTMLERYPKDRGNTHINELRRYLANFGLGGDVLPTQQISTLSGGQKCRLCLAAAMYRKPHLLILDEPTNHLDLETTEALIEAIRGFQGGVILVSHDQHLLTSVCKDLYVVEHGNVEKLRHGSSNGETFAAYKKAVIQGRR